MGRKEFAPFKVTLSSLERREREAVQLPYQSHLLPKRISGGDEGKESGKEMQDDDGFVSEDDEGEEEDPDDDLNI